MPAIMKVSVIVLTYNQEQTVARALDSVLGQKCDYTYEIILADDCSTDSTPDICRHYARKYPDKIRYIANSVNKGVVDNYFDCVLDARGEYIADCAGDDFWTDEYKLQKQTELLESNSDVVLVHTDWMYYDIKSGDMYPPSTTRKERTLFRKSLAPPMSLFMPLLAQERKLGILLNTALYRKSAFMSCYDNDPDLFRNKEFTCEDFQIIVALSRIGSIAFINCVTCCYTVNGRSVTNPGDYKALYRQYYGSIQMHRYIQCKYNVPQSVVYNYHYRILNYLFAQAFRSGDNELRKNTLDTFKQMDVRLSLKSWIKRILSSHNTLWCLSLKLLNP
jgi:glycosyltransferase involved in cell wall biosynthesis